MHIVQLRALLQTAPEILAPHLVPIGLHKDDFRSPLQFQGLKNYLFLKVFYSFVLNG